MVVMVFDIGCLGRELKEGKGGVRGLLLNDGMGRGGKGEERGREATSEALRDTCFYGRLINSFMYVC